MLDKLEHIVTTVDKTADKVDSIGQSQAVYSDRLDRLEHKLFGNGQPGLIAQYGKRLTRVELLIASLYGAVALSGVLWGLWVWVSDHIAHVQWK